MGKADGCKVEGSIVGRTDGDLDGLAVGDAVEGFNVGTVVVGCAVAMGLAVGKGTMVLKVFVGSNVGASKDGVKVGTLLGIVLDGAPVGARSGVGSAVGMSVGSRVCDAEGWALGGLTPPGLDV